MRYVRLMAIGLLAGTASIAAGQWSDNFDGYGPGSINGLGSGGPNALGNWAGWDNSAAAAGTVSGTQARSARHSQEITGGADSVQRYTGVTTGQWSYVAWQFIPTGFTGDTYFILNNVYNHGGPYNWAVQLKFVGTTGRVLDDNGRAENVINYVRGAWAEIRVDFDLNANTLSEYYNGALLASGTWATGGAIALGGVDLFANNASPVYYDDMTLIPTPAGLALLGLGALANRRRR